MLRVQSSYVLWCATNTRLGVCSSKFSSLALPTAHRWLTRSRWPIVTTSTFGALAKCSTRVMAVRSLLGWRYHVVPNLTPSYVQRLKRYVYRTTARRWWLPLSLMVVVVDCLFQLTTIHVAVFHRGWSTSSLPVASAPIWTASRRLAESLSLQRIEIRTESWCCVMSSAHLDLLELASRQCLMCGVWVTCCDAHLHS